MSLKDVTDLLPCEVAQACLARAYPLAVRACLPPPGEPFFDPDAGPYADAAGVVDMLAQQFEIELRRAVGLEFNPHLDLAPVVGVAA